MAHVISFTTDRFDVAKEKPNPINPIAGQAVLQWLREELAAAYYSSTEPKTEDWGWYIYVQGVGGSYLVGASGQPEPPSREIEWVVQIHKQRSLVDKLTGTNRMTAGDPLSALLESMVRGRKEFRDVRVDREP